MLFERLESIEPIAVQLINDLSGAARHRLAKHVLDLPTRWKEDCDSIQRIVAYIQEVSERRKEILTEITTRFA